MAVTPLGGGQRRPTEQEVIALELVSGLLMVIGFLAFAFLFYAIATNDQIREATQGPDIPGIGIDIRQVEPVPTLEDQAHFALSVDAGSRAETAGLQDGDILMMIGDTSIDAASTTEQQLDDVFQETFEAAGGAGMVAIPIQVYRQGETRLAAVPIPVSQNIEDLGLAIGLTPAKELAPYYAITAIDGGEADLIGVRNGDHLVAIDGNDVTALPLPDVEALIAENDVDKKYDDFEIELSLMRPQADGSLKSETRVVPKRVAPTPTIAYLQSFGFVVPVIAIVLGVLFFRLGVRLRQYDLIAARWALVALLWSIMGLVVVAIWAFWVNGKGGLVSDDPFNFGRAITHAVPYLIAIIPLAVSYRWLGNIIDEFFTGEETLSSRQTRFAWTLLVPTLIVLALVAARPLEQTFIKSLTDDEFGTAKPARYVGLDNYENLLSFKFVVVDCAKDEDGECNRTPNGSTIWELSDAEQRERDKLRSLSSEERQRYTRYDEADTWSLLWNGDKGLRLLGKDPTFLNSIFNTLRFTFFSVTLELILGLIIALVVNSNFRGRGLMRAAMLVPWAIPTVVSAVLWQVMLRGDQTGIFNKLLIDLGLLSHTEQWFSTTGPWMNAIVAVDVWKTAPFMALLILAGLQIIPGDLYEAASVDGASRFRQFFSITLPLLRPTIAVALIFRTLDALRAFDVFAVLLDTTRPSMASYNYNRLVLTRSDGYASAVGVMIFIFILIFTVIYVRFVGIERE